MARSKLAYYRQLAVTWVLQGQHKRQAVSVIMQHWPHWLPAIPHRQVEVLSMLFLLPRVTHL